MSSGADAPYIAPAGAAGAPSDKRAADLTKLTAGICLVVLTYLSCLITIVLLWRKRKRLSIQDQESYIDALGSQDLFRYDDYGAAERKLEHYSFLQLHKATQGFHHDNMLGQGGFGEVYKGVLEKEGVVAIKKLRRALADAPSAPPTGQNEFLNEVYMISYVQHKNLVKLLGFCSEGEHRLLVYEFMENNCLSKMLGDKPRILVDWNDRFRICVGVARGLAYLHEESTIRMIHRDIKASNVLLDKDLNPKIADFGLAKLMQADYSHLSTKVVGTSGYVAPEYVFHNYLTEKADVYSFGILALEIVSGRHNMCLELPEEEVFLLSRAWTLFEDGRLLSLVDKKLDNARPAVEAERVITVALCCTQSPPSARPSMSAVVAMLLGNVPVTKLVKPGFVADLDMLRR